MFFTFMFSLSVVCEKLKRNAVVDGQDIHLAPHLAPHWLIKVSLLSQFNKDKRHIGLSVFSTYNSHDAPAACLSLRLPLL